MDKQREDVLEILYEFLRKATRDNATSEEINIIPKVAELLLKYS